MSINSAQVQNLPQKLSDDLIRYIIQESLRPGDKLPNEQEISQRLGVGRSSVREAMKLLASRNIVEIRQGSGTYVSEKQGIAEDPLGFIFFKNNRKLAQDLMDIRFLIEPSIAALAAQNATDEDIKKIVSLCNEVKSVIGCGEIHTQKDIEFHQAIAVSSKNLVVPRLIPVIDHSIEAFVDFTDRKLLDETVQSHREIVQAIVAHNSVAAKDAMYLHLVYNRHFITKAFNA